MINLGLIGIAMAMDFIIGDPPNLPHPIRYIGKLIKTLEMNIRRGFSNLRLGGTVLLLASLIVVIGTTHLIVRIADDIHPIAGIIIKIYILFSALAAKCLDIEARKVYFELKAKNLAGARQKIGYLVGRDTSRLNQAEITRATVETVAENTVDGVLAPLFFIALGLWFGLPCEFVYAYKTTNTLDSMVGYKNENYKDIGWASAKFDDCLNYIPARLGSLAMLLAGAILKLDFKTGFRILIRDRKNHKSPNCGWPESAVAGLLNIQLGGTNVYFGEAVYKPTIGDRLRELDCGDIIGSIRIMYVSELVFGIIIGLIYLGFERI